MVETEANGDSWRTYERGRGPSLFGSLGSSCRYNRFFVLSWLIWWAQYVKYYFRHRTLFHFIIVPIAQQTGQPVVLSRLPLCLCSYCIWYQVFLCKETTTTEKLLVLNTKAWVKRGFLNNTLIIIENISFNFFYKYILISKRERHGKKTTTFLAWVQAWTKYL